jgi:tripartite-type tricarboxylate transporter receptor subunit TctC
MRRADLACGVILLGLAEWSAAVEEASREPAFLKQAERVNKVIRYLGREAFWRFMQDEHKKYLPLAIKIGIRK